MIIILTVWKREFESMLDSPSESVIKKKGWNSWIKVYLLAERKLFWHSITWRGYQKYEFYIAATNALSTSVAKEVRFTSFLLVKWKQLINFITKIFLKTQKLLVWWCLARMKPFLGPCAQSETARPSGNCTEGLSLIAQHALHMWCVGNFVFIFLDVLKVPFCKPRKIVYNFMVSNEVARAAFCLHITLGVCVHVHTQKEREKRGSFFFSAVPLPAVCQAEIKQVCFS